MMRTAILLWKSAVSTCQRLRRCTAKGLCSIIQYKSHQAFLCTSFISLALLWPYFECTLSCTINAELPMMVKPEIIFKSFKRVLKMTWESNVSWSNLNKKNEKLVFCTLKCLLARNYYYYYKRSIIIIFYVFIKSWIIGKGIGIGQKILEQWCIATRTVRLI